MVGLIGFLAVPFQDVRGRERFGGEEFEVGEEEIEVREEEFEIGEEEFEFG